MKKYSANTYIDPVALKLILIPLMVIIACVITAVALNNFINGQKESIEGGVYSNLEHTHKISLLYNKVTENHILIVSLLRKAEKKEIDEEEIYDNGKIIIANLYHQDELIDSILSTSKINPALLDEFINFEKLHDAYHAEASSAITMTTVEPALAHDYLIKANSLYISLGAAYLAFISSSEEESLRDLSKAIDESNALLNNLKYFSVPFVAILVLASVSLGRRVYREISDRERSQLKQLETSRHLAKAHLERANALDATNKATRFFMARMSHELRTPLNAIIGFSNILRTRIDIEVLGKYKEIPERINEAGKHLLNLINDILDIEEIQQGKLTFDLTPCDLESIVEESIELCHNQAKQSGISLVSENLKYTVFCDKMRLKQIIINLITNAIKYGKPNGYVIIFVSKESNGTVSLNIMDNGVGIPAEEQEKLFQPFSRLEYAKKNGIEGSGIGLTLCKYLIEEMEGSVGVVSVEGYGSRFHVTFPSASRSD